MESKTLRTAALGLLPFFAAAPLAGAQTTERVSLTATGAQIPGSSGLPLTTYDGRLVVFTTSTDGVVPADANGSFDAFLRDRVTGELELVSEVPGTGLPGSTSSLARDLSADGRFVAFTSSAPEFFPGDANGAYDVFVKDRETGAVELVSVNVGGTTANDTSGRCVISDDGRFVAFESRATDLVAGDANGDWDIFLRDRELGTTVMITRDTFGGPAAGGSARPDISADGRYVSFESDAWDLVVGDGNGADDVFRFDRLSGTIERVSLDVAGGQLFGSSTDNSMSDDGRFVAFLTTGMLGPVDVNGTGDVAVRDTLLGTTWIGSIDRFGVVTANGLSNLPRISGDGTQLLFCSSATNLVLGDANGAWDMFRVRVGSAGGAERVSVSTAGVAGNLNSLTGALSRDGNQLAFTSYANNLVGGDTNASEDVFVRSLGAGLPVLYCEGKPSSLGCTPSLEFTGLPSASSPLPFVVEGRDFLPDESGILLYGTNGRSSLGFHGGTLCVKAPVVRLLPPKKAWNTGPAPCAGVLRRDFNARIQSGADAALTVGQTVNAQWLQRDAADPAGFGDALSDGIEFTIGN